MKASIRSLLLFAFAGIILTSCFNCVDGKGPVMKTEREEGEFNSILLKSSFDVLLVPSDVNFVTVEAQENLHDLIRTENKNGRLEIYGEECIKYSEPVIITVGVHDLRGVKVSGSGDISGGGLFKTEEVDATISGSGNISLDLSAGSVYASINGSGDITLTGFCDYFEAGISGSGDISAFDLSADDVEAWIAGSGDVRVHALNAIDAKINGSGDITYRGEPTSVETRVNGSGEIRRTE